jgi:hypothetical protein
LRREGRSGIKSRSVRWGNSNVVTEFTIPPAMGEAKDVQSMSSYG